jgi:hypothetical protein
MEQLSGFPFFPVEFDQQAHLVKPQQVEALRTNLQGGGCSDLIVISHGWNNDIADARELYARFLATARQLLDAGSLPQAAARQVWVMGVLWPSKKFADKELIPGGAAGVETVDSGALLATLRDLHGVFDALEAEATLDRMAALVPRLEDSDRACAEFVTLARTLLPLQTAQGEEGEQGESDLDGSSLFVSLPAAEVFERFAQPLSLAEVPASNTGALSLGMASLDPGAQPGGAAGLGSAFSGIGAAAGNVLNLTTYYQMKERAGRIGRGGLNPLLRKWRAEVPSLRLHLVGHSFGARLVSAAMAGEGPATLLPADSLCLLQAAFSHYGFAQRWDGRHDGLFRRVLSGGGLRGPGVISHSVHDIPVGMAYPLASRLAGQVAAGLGDASDRYGGLGRNGAQKTPEAVAGTLLEPGRIYAFQAGKLHNLQADAFVKGHGDITGAQLVSAVLQAITTQA